MQVVARPLRMAVIASRAASAAAMAVAVSAAAVCCDWLRGLRRGSVRGVRAVLEPQLCDAGTGLTQAARLRRRLWLQ